jgi:hypothetical protein
MSGLKSACLTAVFLTGVSIPAFAQDGPAEPFSTAMTQRPSVAD